MGQFLRVFCPTLANAKASGSFVTRFGPTVSLNPICRQFLISFILRQHDIEIIKNDTILKLSFKVHVELVFLKFRGWSGGAKVLGKLPVPGRPTILITVGQGPNALAVGAGGVCLDIFTLTYPFSSLSPSLWETARYRLKYCLKGPLNPKQPTNQNPQIPYRQVILRFCSP